MHDPAKIVLDLAVTLALGGDALSDLATLRAEPGAYGRVASDPTVSRMITSLAGDAGRVLTAISSARQQARQMAWAMAGQHAPHAAATVAAPLCGDVLSLHVTSAVLCTALHGARLRASIARR